MCATSIHTYTCHFASHSLAPLPCTLMHIHDHRCSFSKPSCTSLMLFSQRRQRQQQQPSPRHLLPPLRQVSRHRRRQLAGKLQLCTRREWESLSAEAHRYVSVSSSLSVCLPSFCMCLQFFCPCMLDVRHSRGLILNMKSNVGKHRIFDWFATTQSARIFA